MGNFEMKFHGTVAAHEAEIGRDFGLFTPSPTRDAPERRTVSMRDLPFGTRIYIEDIGEFVVEDRGVGGGIVDVAFDNDADCFAITRKAVVWKLED